MDYGELIALAMNSGLVMVIVQVIKVVLIPRLRLVAPWSLPLIALGLGSASSIVLSNFGVDLSPIVGAFSGLAASGAFAVIKESPLSN